MTNTPTSTSIKRISIDQLQVGMFITDANNQWIPNKNLSRKGLVNHIEVIEKIRAIGVKDLYIDISKGKDYDANPIASKQIKSSSKKPKPKKTMTPSVPIAKEMENAKSIQSEATDLISRCMTDIKMGKAIDVVPVTSLADNMIESLAQNHNALLCVTQLREKDRYLMEHSFNVSVLMGVLASVMGYSGNTLHEMVTGALLHDVGKIRISDKILHKPGKLMPDEWEEMKRHVTYGEDVLKKTPGITPIMLDICAQHHERLDGSGYPRGLSASEIPVHSRMASIVDVYDAITAERVYHKGMAPTTALKKMLKWSMEKHFDQELIYRFIQAMGVYPVGSVVELNNHKLAIVVDVNEADQNKPKVLQIYDLKTRRYDNRFALDLADDLCNIEIVRAVYAETYGIKVGDFV